MALRTFVGMGLLFVFLYLAAKKRHNHRKPPGPKPLPIIGNLLDLPGEKKWLTFTKWKKQYGDLVYLNILGQPLVVLNSRKACDDLMDKRSKKYSDRPRFIMINELMGWDYGLPFMPYSLRWRRYRRSFHQYFNETESRNYITTQEQRTHAFLRNLLKKPDFFRDHIRLLFAETIMEVVYGYEVKGHEDNFLQTIEGAMDGFSIASQMGRFYVETFPFLKAIPSWMPGADFKRQAAYWKKCILASKDEPATYVKEQMEKGTAKPCVLANLLSKCEQEMDFVEEFEDDATKGASAIGDTGESEEEVAKGVSAIAYAGGSDTVLAAFEAFFLAMANHPECQQAAQSELDAVIGRSRLPALEDREDLSYINAVVKEILRWHVIGPMGVAHALTEDDEYRGYFLPKGTIVIANTWGFLHDPEVYSDPDTFNPSRWLIDTPEGKKLNKALPEPDIMFGYGRRICPGRYFADTSLFLGVATVLAAFTIRPLDLEGNPADRCEEGVVGEALIRPIPFNVAVKPRSAAASTLVSETELS